MCACLTFDLEHHFHSVFSFLLSETSAGRALIPVEATQRTGNNIPVRFLKRWCEPTCSPRSERWWLQRERFALQAVLLHVKLSTLLAAVGEW